MPPFLLAPPTFLWKFLAQYLGTLQLLQLTGELSIRITGINYGNHYMGVSENNGTPKSSILIGFSIIFTIHFGVPLFLETPIYNDCFFNPQLDIHNWSTSCDIMAMLLMPSAKSRPLGLDSWCFESLCPRGLKEKNLTRLPHKNSTALSILNCWWQLCKILRSHTENHCGCRIRNHATRARKEEKAIQPFHSTGFVIY